MVKIRVQEVVGLEKIIPVTGIGRIAECIGTAVFGREQNVNQRQKNDYNSRKKIRIKILLVHSSKVSNKKGPAKRQNLYVWRGPKINGTSSEQPYDREAAVCKPPNR